MKKIAYVLKGGQVVEIKSRIHDPFTMREVFVTGKGNIISRDDILAKVVIANAPKWIKDWGQVGKALASVVEPSPYWGKFRLYAKARKNAANGFDGLARVPFWTMDCPAQSECIGTIELARGRG